MTAMTAKQRKLAALLCGAGAVLVLLSAGLHFVIAGMRSYELRLAL